MPIPATKHFTQQLIKSVRHRKFLTAREYGNPQIIATNYNFVPTVIPPTLYVTVHLASLYNYICHLIWSQPLCSKSLCLHTPTPDYLQLLCWWVWHLFGDVKKKPLQPDNYRRLMKTDSYFGRATPICLLYWNFALQQGQFSVMYRYFSHANANWKSAPQILWHFCQIVHENALFYLPTVSVLFFGTCTSPWI